MELLSLEDVCFEVRTETDRNNILEFIKQIDMPVDYQDHKKLSDLSFEQQKLPFFVKFYYTPYAPFHLYSIDTNSTNVSKVLDGSEFADYIPKIEEMLIKRIKDYQNKVMKLADEIKQTEKDIMAISKYFLRKGQKGQF